MIFIFVVLALLLRTLKSALKYEELEDMINEATKQAAKRKEARASGRPYTPGRYGATTTTPRPRRSACTQLNSRKGQSMMEEGIRKRAADKRELQPQSFALSLAGQNQGQEAFLSNGNLASGLAF